MNILDEIIERKKLEIADRKNRIPVKDLEKQVHFSRKTLSLSEYLLAGNKNGIIAEFKRRSPSKGIINDSVSVSEITRGYTKAGASGLSVLTDGYYFGGELKDLEQARENEIPILRKDFLIDEYQIVEAKAIGADVVLLIAACLQKASIKQLAKFAKSLQLEVLLEIHDEKELLHICDEVDIIGVNNRNLKTFKVDIGCSISLSSKIPGDKIRISESGIGDIDTILHLKEFGFDGFLIGEKFMQEKNPAIAFASFVNQLKDRTK
jgi:indole-3-glycerol phosphate synthase